MNVGRIGSHTSLALAAALMSAPSSCRRTATVSAPANEAIEPAATWAGLRVRTIGERQHPRQVVILLHGWGAMGDDLVPLGQELAAPGRLLVFPEAPLASLGGGRAWWPIDLVRIQAVRGRDEERDLRQETPAGLVEARAQMTALVAEVTRRARVAPAAIRIGGFSQGAMLATDVALASPAAVGGLVVLSGSLVSEATWTARLQAMAPGFPIFVSHGRADPVLPFRLAETLRERALAARHAVTWVPFEGGHQIPAAVLARLLLFLGPPESAVGSRAD